MNLLLVILNFILLSGIKVANADNAIGIDILETLKEKHISCDLHNFVISVGDSESEYNALMDDLTRYCSEAESTHMSRILCRMILIELEIGCSLPNTSRPFPIKYTNTYSAAQICSMHKISYTNKWIWGKFTEVEKEQFGSSWVQICETITSKLTGILSLTRFFYKIAPRIRQAEILNITSQLTKASKLSVADKIPSANETNLTNSNEDKIEERKDELSINKTVPIPVSRKKLPTVLDLKSAKSKSLLNKRKDAKRKQHRDNDNNNDDDDDGKVVDSNNVEVDLNVQPKRKNSNDLGLGDPNQDEADVKKVDGVENKQAKKLHSREDILPLGRVGEKPEREQIDERPKPKALDIESVFKPNEREKQNWIEGKQGEIPQRNGPRLNLNLFPRVKHEGNPSNPSPKAKKKFSLKSSRSNVYHDDDFDNWTNRFTTSSLLFILCVIIIYLLVLNKNKIFGLIIEGCRRRRGSYGHRSGGLASSTHHTRLSHSS